MIKKINRPAALVSGININWHISRSHPRFHPKRTGATASRKILG